MDKIKLALFGLSHVHADGMLKGFGAYSDDFCWVGCTDMLCSDKDALEKIIKKNISTELPKLYYDYNELLNEDIDLAVICTDIADHAKIGIKILEHGINLLIEKPMAVSFDDALKLYKTAKENNAEIIVNWPVAWFPSFNKVKEIAGSGRIGKVLRVQYRTPSTPGPYRRNQYSNEELAKTWWYQHDKGGGSIIDYAGYGFLLTSWIIGKKAKSVMGMKKSYFTKFSDVEDFSSFMVDFEDEIGYLEGSWSTVSNGEIPTGPVVYGEKGVIVADRFSEHVLVYDESEPYKPCQPPAEDYEMKYTAQTETIFSHIINHYKHNKPLHELVELEFNMSAMAALDAGIKSCESKKEEIVEFNR